MYSLRHLFTLAIFQVILLPLSTLYGQTTLNAMGQVPSPQATDLGRFGDIPMSYYTGRANITVPVHTFSERGVTLDINLTYDTSGLLMNKLPGWAGPGWTLNAGGCITRSIRNVCDEVYFPNDPAQFTNYFHSYSDLVQSNGSFNSGTVTDSSNYLHKDYNPDIFYFNFMGKTGRFFLGNDGEWKVSSDENLVVEFNINNTNNYIYPLFEYFPNGGGHQPKTIKSFVMYDDDGNKYTFGGDTTSIEYSMNLYQTGINNNIIPWDATSWYLTRVEDRFGNMLYELKYRRGKYMAQMYRSTTSNTSDYCGTFNLPVYLDTINTRSRQVAAFTMERPYTAGQAARSLYPSLYQTNYPISSLLYSYQQYNYPFYYLQTSTDSHALYYNANGTAIYDDPLAGIDIERIKAIAVKTSGNRVITNCTFNYNNTGRYHLASLTFAGRTVQGDYSFIYDDYASVPDDYLTREIDCGGFFNNSEYNLIPSLGYSKKGMLTDIYYPTGGHSHLEYGLNDFGWRMSLDRQSVEAISGTASGLRVERITDYDSTSGTGSVARRRFFKYTDPSTGLSSGQYIADMDDNSYYNMVWYRVGNSVPNYPVIPLCTSLKTMVGYSFVTDSIPGVSTHLYCFCNFKTLGYNPSNGPQPNNPMMEVGNFGDDFGKREFMRGRPTAEYVRDESGAIQSKVLYEYRTDTVVYRAQVVYGFDNKAYLSIYNYNDKGIVKLYYPKYDLQKIATSTMYGSQTVKDTITYIMTDYNISNQQLPRFRKCTVEQTGRAGERMLKQSEYTFVQSNSYFLPLTLTSESYNGTLLHTDEMYYNGLNLAYETTTPGGGVPETTVTYHSYTTSGLPEAFTRKGEYRTRLFWNNKDQLLASVTSPYQGNMDVYETIPSRSLPFDPPVSDTDTLQHLYMGLSPLEVVQYQGQSIFNYPDVKATTYVYGSDDLPMAMATDNGIVTTYVYDINGQLIGIRDVNNKYRKRFSRHYKTGPTQ